MGHGDLPYREASKMHHDKHIEHFPSKLSDYHGAMYMTNKIMAELGNYHAGDLDSFHPNDRERAASYGQGDGAVMAALKDAHKWHDKAAAAHSGT